MAAKTGPGHRTTTVPIRRQRRFVVARLGSNSPNRLATAMIAGASVRDANITVTKPIAHGDARVLK
ncbi:Uncharacterised protein [Mycobacterium tuberculosis]|nr:Uncharacterised protein [Mycobacterium tuberculosis]